MLSANDTPTLTDVTASLLSHRSKSAPIVINIFSHLRRENTVSAAAAVQQFLFDAIARAVARQWFRQ